jgi:hypothetical protein
MPVLSTSLPTAGSYLAQQSSLAAGQRLMQGRTCLPNLRAATAAAAAGKTALSTWQHEGTQQQQQQQQQQPH